MNSLGFKNHLHPLRAFILISINLLPLLSQSQVSDLIQFKSLVDSPSRLKFMPHDSLYVYSFYTYDNESPVGIWSDEILTELNENFRNKYIIYDRNLNFQEYFQLNIAAVEDPMNILGFQNEELFLGLHEYSFGIPEGIPTIQHAFSEFFGHDLLLGYQLSTNVLKAYLNIQDPSFGGLQFNNAAQPFAGYFAASGIHGLGIHANHQIVLMGDHVKLGYFEVYQDHMVNDIIPVNNETDNLGFAYFKFDGEELTVNPMVSSGGNVFNYSLYPSVSLSYYYRIGVIRGENIAINPQGDIYDYASSDSSYSVFISKENQNFETEWITPLYGYNNTNSDTTEIVFDQLQKRNTFHSLVELNNHSFTLQTLNFLINPFDSLKFTDFFGIDTTLYSSMDYFNPDGSVGMSWKVPLSKRLIYNVDENGNPESTLSMNKTNLDIFSPANLFQVDTMMAWVDHYDTSADTLLEIIRETSIGAIDTTFISIPSGAGLLILWIDATLEIMNHWIIPYENSFQFGPGMSIKSMNMYGTDTLLIQGDIRPNTTTTLDIFGENQPTLYPDGLSYFAFYGISAPNNASENRTKNQRLSIYPNPSDGLITVSTDFFSTISAYEIYDLSGRLLLKQHLKKPSSNFSLDVGFLNNGIYILKAFGEGLQGSAKFIIH